MRLYIDGELSVKQETFIPAALWFASEKCRQNTVVSEECFCLEGTYCNSFLRGLKFYGRLKDVYLNCIKDGKYVEIDDFSAEDVINLIKEKNMHLVNIDAHLDSSTYVTITKLSLEGEDVKLNFDTDIFDKIEFIV